MLLQLQDYIQKHHVVSLEELVAHFQVPPAMIELILSQLIRKGRVKKSSLATVAAVISVVFTLLNFTNGESTMLSQAMTNPAQ